MARYVAPGSPRLNGIVESFNGRLRDECLDLEVFWNLAEARVVIGEYQRFFGDDRPHSSLDYLTPHQFKQQHQPTPNRAVLQE